MASNSILVTPDKEIIEDQRNRSDSRFSFPGFGEPEEAAAVANEIEEEEADAVTDAALTDAAVIDMVPDSPAFESSAEILKDATKRKEKATISHDRSGTPVGALCRTTAIKKQ